jgi:glucose-6-phosphate 1-epimerase
MQTIDELNKRFAIADAASFEHGSGDLPRLVISTPAAEAHVYLSGAHVTHYQPRGQEPVLYVSPNSAWQAGKAIRGGVPVIFPWFGSRESDPSAMHGFVRLQNWDVAEVKRDGDSVRAVFTIASSPATRAIWDFDFALKFIVSVGHELTMELEAHSPSSKPIEFEDALHTYYNVANVQNVSVTGLTGTQYLDKTRDMQLTRDDQNPLKLTGRVDRVYLDTPATCVITDPGFQRKIIVEKENSRSTVVWNPWHDMAKQMVDLKAEEWDNFLCVETCNVKSDSVKLAPGARHVLKARVKTEPM